ncbi:MAG: hypothetical protein M3P49_07240 [Actinomycetota bacterium]|nr:hypothetical protein [Actinomycetota bacterium]
MHCTSVTRLVVEFVVDEAFLDEIVGLCEAFLPVLAQHLGNPHNAGHLDLGTVVEVEMPTDSPESPSASISGSLILTPAPLPSAQ